MEDKNTRRERWVALMAQGVTMQSIANSEGLSRERVRQVVGPDVPRHHSQRQSKLAEQFAAYPTLSAKEISQRAGYRYARYALLRALGWRPTVVEWAHCTVNRYRQGCRCEPCRAAVCEVHRKWLGQVKETPAHAHGTANGYMNYRCRCAPCREAGSAHNKRYSKRRKPQKERAVG